MKTFFPRRIYLVSSAVGLVLTSMTVAQVPDAPASGGGAAPAAKPAAQPAQGGGSGGQKSDGSFLGKDVPVYDPGTENMTWDGRTWNTNNNRIFQSRFEKYLNAQEETNTTSIAYQQVVSKILSLLAPGNATVQNVDAAFGL